MQRPTGITILAISDWVGGSISLLTSCFAMAVASRLAATAGRANGGALVLAPDFAHWANLVFWTGVIGIGSSVLRMVAAAGLWTLNPLGWRLALVRNALKLATCPVAMVRDGLTTSGVVGALIDGAVLFYLARADVRQAFSGAPIDAPTTAP